MQTIAHIKWLFLIDVWLQVSLLNEVLWRFTLHYINTVNIHHSHHLTMSQLTSKALNSQPTLSTWILTITSIQYIIFINKYVWSECCHDRVLQILTLHHVYWRFQLFSVTPDKVCFYRMIFHHRWHHSLSYQMNFFYEWLSWHNPIFILEMCDTFSK